MSEDRRTEPRPDGWPAQGQVTSVAERFEGLEVTTTAVVGDVVETLVAATADHDLTIIGSAQEGLLQELVFGAIPVEVGQRSKSTVVVTKRYLGITSRLRRWLRWN